MMRASTALPALALLLVGLTGCPGLTGGAGARPDGFRLVEGALVLEDEGIVGRQVAGLQLVAVTIRDSDGAAVAEVFASDVLQPSDRTSTPFVVAVPTAHAFHVVLQVPGGAGSAPGEWLGALFFSDGRAGETSLIPSGSEDLQLGTVRALDGDPSQVADNRLEVDSASNPLAQIEHDDDGVSDLLDDDDDGDLLPDAQDTDVAGDGIEDALQLLSALPDADADGVPDAFEP